MTERSSLLGRIGGASAARPWRTVVAWVLALVAAVGLSAVIGGSTRDNYTIPGMPAQAGTDLLAQRFPDISGADARVVIHDPAGGRLDSALLGTVADRLRELPDMGAVEPPRLSADGDTAVLTVRFSVPVTDFSGREGVDLLDAAVQPARDAGLQVALGGSVPENFSPPSGTAESVGIVAALLILIVAMGTIVGAGLPLVVALVGLGIGTSVIAIVARFADVSPTAPTIASMVGLGVGIDYALLLVARQVEGMRIGLSPRAAATQATATAGTSVVIAGLTVLVSLLGLRLSTLNTYASFGYATAIVVLVVMAASITLVPAVGALAGHRLLPRRTRSTVRPAAGQSKLRLLPRRTRSTVRPAAGQSKLSLLRRRERRAVAPPADDTVDTADTVERPDARVQTTRIARWAGFVGRHPTTAALASLLVLGALAAPVVGMRTWPQDAGSQPESNTTRQAYDLVATEFGAGANGPLLVVADLTQVSTVEQLAARLAREDGVAAVAPPVYNAKRDAALLVVEPETGPQDERTSELLDRIRTQLLPEGAHVTGLVAVYADISDRLAERLWVVIGFVVAVSLLLLTLLLRAPVVAAKAAVMNLLSVVAAYGVVTAVFQSDNGAHLVGLPHAVPVSSWVPILMFTVLFGLSMDYEVFLLTRVRERWLATGDATRSVVEGLAATGRVITSAAAIMVAVFTGFALDPDVTVKTTGLGMAVAVLIDATLVRMVLVPATMALLGRWNWWLPGWLDRALPRLRHGAGVQLAQSSE